MCVFTAVLMVQKIGLSKDKIGFVKYALMILESYIKKNRKFKENQMDILFGRQLICNKINLLLLTTIQLQGGPQLS